MSMTFEDPRHPALRFGVMASITVAFFLANHDVLYSTGIQLDASLEILATVLDGGDPLRRAAFIGLAVMGATLILIRPHLARVGAVGALLILYMGWGGISALWSDDPQQTIRRLIVLGCLVVAALGLTRMLTLRDLRTFLILNCAAILAVGLASEIALGNFDPLSSAHRFSGTVHPNGQGVNCALLVLATASLARERGVRLRGVLAGLIVVGLVALLMTRSRTALAACGAGLFVVYAPSIKRRKRGGVVLGLYLTSAVTVALLLLFVDGLMPFVGDAASLGRAEVASTNLTGRVPLWIELSSYILDRPLLGYGYEAFWGAERVIVVSSATGWSVASAHSIYFELLLNVGVVGFTLFVLLVGALTRALVTPTAMKHDRLVIALLVFGCLQGLMETALLGPNVLYFAFLWSATAKGFPVAEPRRAFSAAAKQGKLVRPAKSLALRR